MVAVTPAQGVRNWSPKTRAQGVGGIRPAGGARGAVTLHGQPASARGRSGSRLSLMRTPAVSGRCPCCGGLSRLGSSSSTPWAAAWDARPRILGIPAKASAGERPGLEGCALRFCCASAFWGDIMAAGNRKAARAPHSPPLSLYCLALPEGKVGRLARGASCSPGGRHQVRGPESQPWHLDLWRI